MILRYTTCFNIMHVQSCTLLPLDDRLAPMSGQAVEKLEDTASHGDATCDTNIAVSSSLITDVRHN